MRDAGRIAAAIDRAPEAPHSVSKLQAMRQMQSDGIWNDFTAWRALNPQQSAEWDAAHEIHRRDQWTRAVAAEFGMNDAAVDRFFREAAKR